MPVRLYFFLIVITFSCTIIEESDITTQQELQEHIQARRNSIQLKTIEITQSDGEGETVSFEKKITATVVKNDTINLSTPEGKVTRHVEIDLPALGNTILKFQSEVNSALKIYEDFLSDGRPYTFKVFQNTTALESYEFRYDNQKRLNRILFLLNGQIVSDDTLIYRTDGKIATITRRSPDTSKQGTISIDYYGEIEQYAIRKITPGFQSFRYEDISSAGSCDNLVAPNKCKAFQRASIQTGGAKLGMRILETYDPILNDAGDIRLSESALDGAKGTTYYFHPLMLLNGLSLIENSLIQIYTIDWWIINEALENGGSSIVKFKYTYGL